MAKVTNASNAKILAERQRTLQPIDFAPATVLSRELPRDTCLKSLLFTLNGSVVTTYGSGTPLADAQSTFDNLVENITVTVDGARIVKSVRPHMMAAQMVLTSKVYPDRRASAGAAQVVQPTVDGGFVYGTTGQVTTVYETLLLSFENVYAMEGKGREMTWLNLKGTSSAEVRVATKGYASLLCFGNTAPVVYSAGNLRITIQTVEQQDVQSSEVFADLKQTTKQIQIAGQQTGLLIEINKGNFLQGIMLFCQDGAAGAATGATGNLATNFLLNSVKVKVNGQQDIKATDFLSLQSENRNRQGLVSPTVANVSRLDGIAYLDMLKDDDASTALDCRAPLVDALHLELSSRGGTEFSYNAAKPATVTIMTNEIVLPA